LSLSNTSGLAKANGSVGRGQHPLSFEANAGQLDAQVRFLARGRSYGFFLTNREAVLELRKTYSHVGAGFSTENRGYHAWQEGMTLRAELSLQPTTFAN